MPKSTTVTGFGTAMLCYWRRRGLNLDKVASTPCECPTKHILNINKQ